MKSTSFLPFSSFDFRSWTEIRTTKALTSPAAVWLQLYFSNRTGNISVGGIFWNIVAWGILIRWGCLSPLLWVFSISWHFTKKFLFTSVKNKSCYHQVSERNNSWKCDPSKPTWHTCTVCFRTLRDVKFHTFIEVTTSCVVSNQGKS